MSRLNVDKITGATGTASGAPITLSGDTATLGSTVTFPAGSIINYKFVEIGVFELSGTYTVFNISSAATSTQGLQVVTTSFSPNSANSKIFCQAQLFVQEDANISDWAMAALFVDTDILSQQINNDRAEASNFEQVVATLSGEYTNTSLTAKTIQVRASGDTNTAIDVNVYNRSGSKNAGGYIRTGLSIFEIQQ